MQANRQDMNNQGYSKDPASNWKNQRNFDNDPRSMQNERNFPHSSDRNPSGNARYIPSYPDDSWNNSNYPSGPDNQRYPEYKGEPQKAGRFIRDPQSSKYVDDSQYNPSSTGAVRVNKNDPSGRDNERYVLNKGQTQKAGRFIKDPQGLNNYVDNSPPSSTVTAGYFSATHSSAPQNNPRDVAYDPPAEQAQRFIQSNQRVVSSSDPKQNAAKLTSGRTDRDISFVKTNQRSIESNLPIKSYILWMDEYSQDNMYVETQLKSNQDIEIEFRQNFSDAQDHLRRILDRIRSPSTTFQIICRGYYTVEDKNPLDLLIFLNQNSLQHIPVTVFTRNKDFLVSRLKQNGPLKRVYDWQERLKIVVDAQDLMKQCKMNIKSKIDGNSRSRAN